MNLVFATTCTDSYVELLTVFIKSILRHNPEFDKTFYVFHDQRLSFESQEELIRHYMGFKFMSIWNPNYSFHGKNNPKYFSLECFNLQDMGIDKIVYFGCDVICKGDISPLYEAAENVETIGMSKEKRRPCFNNNCMIIDKSIIDKKVYGDLLKHSTENLGTFGTDQAVLNVYFKNKITETEHRFNVLVTEINEIKWEEIIFLHYIHKPTNKIGRSNLGEHLVNVWEDYKNNS